MFGVNKKSYADLWVLIGLIVIATVISSDFSRDSRVYNNFYKFYGASGWDGLGAEIFQRELFFLVVSKLFYKLGLDAVFLFLTYSVISLSIKYFLIREYSKDKLLSLSFFVSYFFILHDSTQIRFSIAIAFSYLGLHYLADNKKLLFSAIVVFSAIMFHNAVLVFIVMLFFTSTSSRSWLLGMVVIAIVLYPVNLSGVLGDIVGYVINYFDVSGTRLNRLYLYLTAPKTDLFLGMFSRSAMLVYLCALVIFQYRDKFSAYEILCYNAFIMSIFFYILLKDTVDLQVRVRDLFGFSLVFLMPFIHRGMSKYIGHRNAYIILYLYLGVHLIKFAIYDKMLIL